MGAERHITLDSLAWNPFGEGEFDGVLDNAMQKLEHDRSFYTLEFVRDEGRGRKNPSIIYFIDLSESECAIHAMYFGEKQGTRKLSAGLKFPAQRVDDALEMLVGIGVGDSVRNYVHKPPKRTTRHLVDVLQDHLSQPRLVHDHVHRGQVSGRAYFTPLISTTG